MERNRHWRALVSGAVLLAVVEGVSLRASEAAPRSSSEPQANATDKPAVLAHGDGRAASSRKLRHPHSVLLNGGKSRSSQPASVLVGQPHAGQLPEPRKVARNTATSRQPRLALAEPGPSASKARGQKIAQAALKKAAAPGGSANAEQASTVVGPADQATTMRRPAEQATTITRPSERSVPLPTVVALPRELDKTMAVAAVATRVETAPVNRQLATGGSLVSRAALTTAANPLRAAVGTSPSNPLRAEGPEAKAMAGTPDEGLQIGKR